MGFSCPVCGDPQADGVHLANHLAFTAMVRGGDHETWLDEHVPGWGQLDDDGLAAEVTDLAEETEYPRVFEDTTGDTTHDHGESELPDGAREYRDADLDGATADILEKARELTRRRRNVDSVEDGDGGDGGDE